MKSLVAFRSNAFPPFPDEERKVNPGRYGRRLAEFLAGGLKSKGFEPLEPLAEDWGWVLPIRVNSRKLLIGCGNYEEFEDGFLCFIEPDAANTESIVLQAAIDQLLSQTPAVRDKQWFTLDEFNRPSP